MITHILMEYLGLGALPVYDCEPDIQRYILEFQDPLALYEGSGYWREVPSSSQRLIVPLNIDADLAECQGQIPDWIRQAQELPGDGTLIFSIQAQAPVGGIDYLCAGLAYVSQAIAQADPLEATDPADLIRQVLLRNVNHPIVRGVLDRHAEEVERHRRYWEMAEAARAIERKASHVAFKRASRLLNGCLTPKQRRELRKKQHIRVIGQDGQLYRIEERSHQNVFLIQDGEPLFQYCVVTQGEKIPVPDLMLAQKLMLESCLEDFMKLANKWDLRGVSRVGRRERVIPANYWENLDNFRMNPAEFERILDLEVEPQGCPRAEALNDQPIEQQLDVAV